MKRKIIVNKFYFNLFGQVRKNSGEKNIISNYLYFEKEKEEYIKNINKQNKEIEKLKMIIKKLCIDNPVEKKIYEAIPKECENVLKNLAKENGGKITLNDEENRYMFRKTKNMFEGIGKNIIQKSENKVEEQNNINNEEVMKREENKDNNGDIN